MAEQELIQFKGVGKTFKSSGVEAVKDLSLSIGKGEIIGLMGANGAGKTTTLRMISTMIKPTAGSLLVNGYNVRTHPREVRRRIGLLFGQQEGLYDRLTARENILYFASLYGMPAKETDAKLKPLTDLLEMSSFLDRRAGTFSTGMRQKTLIARTLIHDPDLLLLDEPATGLDIRGTRHVYGFIRIYRSLGKTVIFSSHNPHGVREISDRILIMKEGRLMGAGTPAALETKQPLEDYFLSPGERG